ncbi:MAG: GNAT family N-acetyltransferase [Candidatus Heimdallarchaeota archaeon]|nr:GNAT family N-acetyltransferase [Candidatus Heimdallarchaeota archaeon]MCK5048508.1 GNAT family N-acetyltransferase [Candidatus Heimdallarchaeota archaeon]
MDLDKIARFYPRKARMDDLKEASDLLIKHDLPVDGIEDNFDNFLVLISNNTGEILGLVGIEKYDQIGLLRSLVIEKGFQGLGLGKKMLIAIEKYAKELGLISLFLFTDTAEKFFEKHNYSKLSIENADERLKQSVEFTICSSAILMKKSL